MRADVTLRHARFQILEVARAPAYLAPVFIFPTLFFLYFAQPNIETRRDANLYLACYALYAILGVVFYLLLGALSDDRRNAWEDYLQTLPHGAWVRITAWALTATLAAAGAVLAISLTARLSTPLHLGITSWLLLLLVAVVGALPFGLLAMAVAYWVPARFTQPIGNVIYFSLAFGGGFWTLPDGLPGWMATISPYLPTRMWAELGWAIVDGRPWPYLEMQGLLLYGALFGVVAYLGLRRYLRQRYR